MQYFVLYHVKENYELSSAFLLTFKMSSLYQAQNNMWKYFFSWSLEKTCLGPAIVEFLT